MVILPIYPNCPIPDEYIQYTSDIWRDGGAVHGYSRFRSFVPLGGNSSYGEIMESTERRGQRET